jgi:hypothetical protein
MTYQPQTRPDPTDTRPVCIICSVMGLRGDDVHRTIADCDDMYGECDAPEEHHTYTPGPESDDDELQS